MITRILYAAIQRERVSPLQPPGFPEIGFAKPHNNKCGSGGWKDTMEGPSLRWNSR